MPGINNSKILWYLCCGINTNLTNNLHAKIPVKTIPVQ